MNVSLPFEIVRVDAGRWKLLRDVRLLALQESPEAFGARYADEKLMTRDDWVTRIETGAWFVATSHDDAIGVMAGLRPPDYPPEVRKLVSAWVAPSARGTGLAAAMVETVSSWAASDGGTIVKLAVVDNNARARRSYEKLGFTFTGNRAPWSGSSDANPPIFLEYVRAIKQ